MCDYSLHSVRNRLAVEGEQLVVHRFPTSSLGLAPAGELQSEASIRGSGRIRRWTQLWSKFQHWLNDCLREPVCAVCIPPGARLVVRDVPERLRRQFGLQEEEEVTFTQLSASENYYRDAVRFRSGAELLLQRLEPGQRVDVLALAPVPAEETPERVWAEIERL